MESWYCELVDGYRSLTSGENVYIWESPVSRGYFKVIRLNENRKKERCQN